jgi:hypothetical protein
MNTIAQQLGITLTEGNPWVIKHNGNTVYYEDSEGAWCA